MGNGGHLSERLLLRGGNRTVLVLGDLDRPLKLLLLESENIFYMDIKHIVLNF